MSPTGTVILAALAALGGLAGSGAALYTAVTSRAKVAAEGAKASAEGDATRVQAAVAHSADQRAWVQTFLDQAARAEKRADEAEAKAAAAERFARQSDVDCRRRCDAQDLIIAGLVMYARTLQNEVAAGGGTPSTPPASISPPL